MTEFQKRFEVPNQPVVITDVVPHWPALHQWTWDYLSKELKDTDIVAGSYDMSFEGFLGYCKAQNDEMPLYLFDKHILKSCPKLAKDFNVPEYFKEDLFGLLGENTRPDYRCEVYLYPRTYADHIILTL